MGVVTERIYDASRAYAIWVSEKQGAGKCANGIDDATYLVIHDLGGHAISLLTPSRLEFLSITHLSWG